MTEIWTYQHRTRIVFGAGAISNLKAELDLIPHEKCMIVTGRSFVRSSGLLEKIRNITGTNSIIYDEVPPNPDVDTVDRGAALFRKENCDMIIGLGGGSAIDCAKSIAVMAHHKGSIHNYLIQKRSFSEKGAQS